LKGKDATKVRVVKDPNPDSEDFMYDAIDKFHNGEEKIMLNPNTEEVEEDGLKMDLGDEVMALKGDSSSDEDDDDDEEDDGDDDGDGEGKKVNDEDFDGGDMDDDDDDDSSDDDEDKVDSELPSDKAWGSKKKDFYNADVDDDDVYSSGEEAELAAADEEEEAMSLQKRLAQQLDTQDFYTCDEPGKQEDEAKDSDEVAVPKDLSKLSKREKLEILAKDSPELLPLLDEYKEKSQELRETYHPLLLMARRGLIANTEGVKFIELKHQLLLNYLVNVSFYLALKAGRENTKGHPVIDVLVQHQQLLAQLKPFDEKMKAEIEDFLPKHKHLLKESFTAVTSKTSTKDSQTLQDELRERTAKRAKLDNDSDDNKIDSALMDPLKYYNIIKAQHEKEKLLKKCKISDNDQEEMEDQENEENDDEEGSKRMITYEMSKNKGMIRKRRKELKNPRVKHKMKYKKAVIKRKGQVKEVQNEMNRYGGELTGIKSTLSRSTKIR